MQELAEQIGIRIKSIRKQRCMTQAYLAEKASISTDFISRAERGVNTASIITLKAIADALDVPLYQLLNLGNGVPINKDLMLISHLLKSCDDTKLNKIARVIEIIIND